MKQTLTLILVALFVALSAPAHAQLLPSSQSMPLDRIVAVVEGGVILQSELGQAVETVLRQLEGSGQQLPPRDVLQAQVLDRLILQRLQLMRANESGIRISERDINQAVSRIAAENRLTPEQMRQALESRGIIYADFRQQIGDQILVQKNRQQVLSGSIQVSDAEIDNLLNSPAFDPSEVHLRHIMIAVPQGAGPESIRAALAKAQSVRSEIDQGSDFAAAAIRYSDASDALEGGDLGWRPMSEVPQGFQEAVVKMQPGDVAGPVRGITGFHLLKLVDRREQSPTVVTEYHARHIMLTPDLLMSATEAKQKAEELRQKIVDEGADFAELARENSDDDTTANQGGDMGWFQLDAWGRGIGEQVTKLAKDEVSEPFRTEGGWHILQRLGKREQDRSTEMRRAAARQAIENRKAEEFYNNYLRELRAMAYIDIRLGNDDNGDQPNRGGEPSGS